MKMDLVRDKSAEEIEAVSCSEKVAIMCPTGDSVTHLQ